MTTNLGSSVPVSSSQITESEYLASRVDDQIRWYSAKSAACQTGYKSLRVTEVVAAALIPFLSAMGASVPCGAWVIGFLGALIAVAAASAGIFKYHENWIQYRATAEQLQGEKYLFLARVTPYADADAFLTFVQRVEGLISKENSLWTQTFKPTVKPEATT